MRLGWDLVAQQEIITGHFSYRPSSSNNLVYSSIEDPIGLAFDTNISNITITGDFNVNVSFQTGLIQKN